MVLLPHAGRILLARILPDNNNNSNNSYNSHNVCPIVFLSAILGEADYRVIILLQLYGVIQLQLQGVI